MTPADIDPKVITQRAAWILEVISALRELPLEDKEAFFRQRHHLAAAESYLRRSLEAVFDIGRHILLKKFAFPATEHGEIARGLLEKTILNEEETELMRRMAGYRNRMVHFYHEITPDELYEICLNHLDEIKVLLARLLESIRGEASGEKGPEGPSSLGLEGLSGVPAVRLGKLAWFGPGHGN